MQRVALLLFGTLLLVSCSAQKLAVHQGTETAPISSQIPVRLELEHEISGRIVSLPLNNPAGLALDPQDNLYVTDEGNNRLLKFDQNWQPVRQFGGYGSGNGHFINPEDVVVDGGLQIYVLDVGNSRLVQLDANLNYVDEIIPQNAPDEIISTMSRYSGLQISSLGEIMVADYDNSRLILMDNFRKFSRYIGDFGYGKGALLNPEGIALDRGGNIYVADAGNARIATYDSFGNYIGSFGGEELKYPLALAISYNHTVWVADGQTDSLYTYDKNGRFIRSFGNPAVRDKDFSRINSIVITRENRLYIADGNNNRVMVYRIIYEAIE